MNIAQFVIAATLGSLLAIQGCDNPKNVEAGPATGEETPLLESQSEPWKSGQLIEPAVLESRFSMEGQKMPTIFNIGPSGSIKSAIDIGPAREKENLEKLKAELQGLPRDSEVIIYCGCCPFGDCPNIRPAFSLLNDMGFTSHKLLNLPQNLKVDWIDKGYPMAE